MTCSGSYIKWIYNAFGDCIVTTREKIGFAFGLSSTVIWMWAQIPQMYLNYKNKQTEGLSFAFLCLLVSGDLCNLFGIIITHGLITQFITCTWFLIQDFLVTVQFIYYTYIRPRCCPQSTNSVKYDRGGNYNNIIPAIPLLLAVSQSASNLKSDSLKGPYDPPTLYGTLLGWASAASYIVSRTPQIIKNFKRKKTDGLSPQFFITAVLGNTTYGLSIFLKDSSWKYIWSQFPWIVGSLGILFFDFTLLFQFIYFKAEIHEPEISTITDFTMSAGQSLEPDATPIA